jgi:hypothetical protein
VGVEAGGGGKWQGAGRASAAVPVPWRAAPSKGHRATSPVSARGVLSRALEPDPGTYRQAPGARRRAPPAAARARGRPSLRSQPPAAANGPQARGAGGRRRLWAAAVVRTRRRSRTARRAEGARAGAGASGQRASGRPRLRARQDRRGPRRPSGRGRNPDPRTPLTTRPECPSDGRRGGRPSRGCPAWPRMRARPTWSLR